VKTKPCLIFRPDLDLFSWMKRRDDGDENLEGFFSKPSASLCWRLLYVWAWVFVWTVLSAQGNSSPYQERAFSFPFSSQSIC
jgi:hypothetical protein